jgi:DNA primase large subunit
MKSVIKKIVVSFMIVLFSSGIVFAAQGAGENWGVLKKMKKRSEIKDTMEDIKECVASKGIDADSDCFEVKEAVEACMAEAGIDIDAELDEFQTKIAEGMVDHVVADIARHIIMKAVATKKMELAETVGTCMDAAGVIDLENFDPETFDLDTAIEALGGCLAEAGIEIDENVIAKIEEIKAMISDDVVQQISEHIAEEIAKHIEHMQAAEQIKSCMDASGVIDLENFDPETFDPVAVREALGVCLEEAGVEIDEDIIAKIEEIEARFTDDVVNHMAEEIAEHIEHMQIAEDVETCVEATGVIDMENFDPRNIDFVAVKTAVEGCLEKAGVDIAAEIKAEMDEIEAMIEEHLEMAETVKTCMDAAGIDPKNFDPETFDMDAFKETLTGCLEEAGIDAEAIIAECEARHPELTAIVECIDAVDFSGDPETIKDQIGACLVSE